MSVETLAIFEALVAHAKAMAVCGARLLPIVFLAPFLGGQAAPTTVRLATVLALSAGVHFAGGVGTELAQLDLWALAAAVVREMAFGLAIGLIASLPFDAARMGGRFIDLFRGSSAEAALPVSGSREAATGDALFHLVVALAIGSGAAGAVVAAVWRTFVLVPVGTAGAGEALSTLVVRVAAGAFAAGLAIGAPIAALSLAIDATLGLFARASPQLHLGEIGTPIKILAGGAVLWLAVGVICHRLLEEVGATGDWLQGAAEVSR